MKISHYINILNEQTQRQKLENSRRVLNLSYSDFEQILIAKGNHILQVVRKENKDFIINKSNETFIKYCYLWISGNKSFPGNLNSGILACGAWGVGKTLILKSLISIYNDNFLFENFKLNQNIKTIYGCEFNDYFTDKINRKYLHKIPLFIDDLAKEEQQIAEYNNVRFPMQEILMIRNENGALTFATSNLNEQNLLKLYYGTVSDRFNLIFNIFEFKENKSIRK